MLKKTSKKNQRVVVAMSGGVDSSVAAYLLKKEGYDVVGIFLKFWQPPKGVCGVERENACCNLESLAMARQIADRLDIPFYVIHVEDYFKKEIVDNFISEYESGFTPNPCVRCNRYIKFGFLWEKARQLGADYLATGHYIRLKRSRIMRSRDAVKDQTYFLSSIEPKILPHLLFPLGDLEKKEARAIAKKAKLPVFSKKDSVGICFVPDGDNENFLSKFSKKLTKSGNIVDKSGNILGRHQGLLGYTIGQKIGDSEIAAKYFLKTKNYKLKNKPDIPRLYVLSIDTKKNQLVIGENQDCFSDTFIAKDLNIIDSRFWDMIKDGKTFYAQIRGGHKAEKCKIESKIKKSTTIIVKFLKPVRAITPGQTVAFYDKNTLLGGGIIEL